MCIIFNAWRTRTVKHRKWCTWHRKASAKTRVSLTRFLQSEVKIIHIIVQDQDGQNNNISFHFKYVLSGKICYALIWIFSFMVTDVGTIRCWCHSDGLRNFFAILPSIISSKSYGSCKNSQMAKETCKVYITF